MLPVTAALVTLVLLGAGCKPAPTPGEPAGQEAAEPAVKQTIGTGDCRHDYYPLMPGYSVSYRQTYGERQVNYVMTITEADDKRAKMEFKFDQIAEVGKEFTFTQELSCSGGNLMPDGYLDMSEAFGGPKVRIETEEIEGVLMPEGLQNGSVWTSSYVMKMTPADSSHPMAAYGAMKSDVSVVNTVVGEETITVPAGTFDTLKVESVSTTTTEMTGLPNMPPSETTMTEYEWWARGVGMVKSESGDGSSVIEAIDVDVP